MNPNEIWKGVFIEHPGYMSLFCFLIRIISIQVIPNKLNKALKNMFKYFWKGVPEFSEKFWNREQERKTDLRVPRKQESAQEENEKPFYTIYDSSKGMEEKIHKPLDRQH